MLEDRFSLGVHSEEKQVSVFTLTADKPKLKEADPSGRSKCTAGPALTAAIAGALPQRMITCVNSTTAQFAERLHGMASSYINRPVVDLTGLSGAYDFSFSYTGAPLLQAKGNEDNDAPYGAVESLFEALQKQTGLKLTTAEAPDAGPCDRSR